MTRFARRNVVGSQKKPYDATRWRDMRATRKQKQKQKEKTAPDVSLRSILKKKDTVQCKDREKQLNKSKSELYEKRVCFKCQQPGHKMTNCPVKGDVEDKSELLELKERWKKEKRSDWRRQKRQKVKGAKMVCFNCRTPGHMMSECPDIKNDQEQGTGICFKCGSTEHSFSKCGLKLAPGVFPYAKCFICNETGHLSRQCPDNPRGLYPNGGCCNECGSVEHLKRNCPELQKKQGILDMKVSRIDDFKSADDDLIDSEVTAIKKKTGPKVVKF